MKKTLFFLILLCAFASPLKGEVVSVTVGWTAGLCDARCAKFVSDQFKLLVGVSSVEVNQEGGFAKIYWKPNKPFDWQMINVTMRRIGLSIQYVNVSVRGTIIRQNNTYSISSLGDNTRFQLLSLPPPSSTQQVAYRSLEAYQLSDELVRVMTEAQKTHATVSVEGYLFQPWRNPLAIVVERYSVHQ